MKMIEKLTSNIKENVSNINNILRIEKSFDLVEKPMSIGGADAHIYMVDGFVSSDIQERLMEVFSYIKKDEMPKDINTFVKVCIPFGQVSTESVVENIYINILTGITCLLLDGFNEAILIDFRNYPMRSVSEPEKDKVLKGSRDGFVETIVFNTALIRRRIRSPQLIMKMKTAGDNSHTNIVLAYMENRVDKEFLVELERRIDNLQVDAMTMNQQSLAECIFPYKWFNPFPKFKFSERPDTAAACILEGSIVVLVDNSPAAMIIPVSVFDIIEQADDYYFPPITGTYLRLTRLIVNIVTFALTPTWLLLTQNTQWVPEWLEFIMVADTVNVPVIYQFLILEVAIDGMKLAALNTPNMLNMPLSIVTGLVLGDFSVSSGWFNSEVMLYMAFVTVANYSQVSYELGYALKFMRIISLVLTGIFNVYGYIAGWLITIMAIIFNKTISGKSYIYPLVPFKWNEILRRIVRVRIKYEIKGENKEK